MRRFLISANGIHVLCRYMYVRVYVYMHTCILTCIPIHASQYNTAVCVHEKFLFIIYRVSTLPLMEHKKEHSLKTCSVAWCLVHGTTVSVR